MATDITGSNFVSFGKVGAEVEGGNGILPVPPSGKIVPRFDPTNPSGAQTRSAPPAFVNSDIPATHDSPARRFPGVFAKIREVFQIYGVQEGLNASEIAALLHRDYPEILGKDIGPHLNHMFQNHEIVRVSIGKYCRHPKTAPLPVSEQETEPSESSEPSQPQTAPTPMPAANSSVDVESPHSLIRRAIDALQEWEARLNKREAALARIKQAFEELNQ
jgi:hypothetical protein